VKSQAQIKGHPIHPMLVGFPIAFLYGALGFDDRCTHKGGPLADGVLICGTVQCPWHGSQFDARTGAVKAGPADKPIGTYAVEVVDGEVRLSL
jgi:nitrite reductase/ring-hydroxylating ferredoxin subunit